MEEKKERIKWYTVSDLWCSNCHWTGDLRIPFGTLMSEVTCIGCGCVSLAYKVPDKDIHKEEVKEG